MLRYELVGVKIYGKIVVPSFKKEEKSSKINVKEV
jgi:hypothetical protein